MNRSVWGALLVVCFLPGTAAQGQAYGWYGAHDSWATWDEFGHPAPAPCKRVPVRTYWTSDYCTGAPVAASCAQLSLYPPLRTGASFDPYDRGSEWTWSW